VTVLVIGATRILRPAVVTLAGGGATVVAGSRSAADLDALAAQVPGVVPVPADGLATGGLGTALTDLRLRPTGGLCYLPGADAAVRRQLAALVDGPLVQLLPSAWAAPDAQRQDVGGPSLQLGWTGDPARWHTPEEISTAALDVLHKGRDAVLGRVRPWEERPG
jgi:hypothetical protein